MAFLDPLADLPKPQKIVMGVAGLLIVAGLVYFLLLSPRMAERNSLFQQNEALRAEVVKARADEANLREFRVQATALRKRLDAARARMPAEKEMPALYRQLSDLALRSGLNVALFAPKPPENHAAFSEVPITVNAEAGYHQLGAFFDRVGRLPRLVALNDFRLTGINQPTGSVRAELNMATYIYKPEGAPAPPTSGGPAPARPPGPAPAGGRR